MCKCTIITIFDILHKNIIECGQLSSRYKALAQTTISFLGMLETKTGPGELFTSIIKEQFETLRDSDRFWFENEENQLRY